MATPPNNDAPPPGRSRPKSQSPPPPIEYQYMYEKNKSPTKLLDALLRAISRHIICEIGDKGVGQLTPDKLAAFYKAVGGDYDSLFVDMPTASISFIWQVTGCQHTLQPTEDDFAPPTIPALTPRGFSRWESLEILLGPEEHVPFLQFAVKNWNLRHPETGQVFPADLPKSVFPTEPDDAVDQWHKSCANKLRQEASREREATANSGPEPEQQEPKVAYAHVRKPFQNRARPADPTYFERPVSYNHVPGRHAGGGRPPNRTSPERYHEERDRNMDDQARRRSFSDYNASKRHEPPPTYNRGATYLDPNMTKRPEPARRPSQPRHSSSESDEEPIPPRTARRHDNSPPCPPPRFPDGSSRQPSPPSVYRHRSDLRSDDERRRSGPSPGLREKLSEKVSNMLPNGFGPDRPRNTGRPSSYNESSRPRRNRENPPSRLSRSYSDLDSNASSGPDDSEDEYQWRKKTREDRDVDRDRIRENQGRPKGGPDRDDDRRERQYPRRPNVGRRTSSHADMDRQRDYPPWEPRNRDQMREDRKRWDKRGLHDERGVSPMSGASGRRYPEASHA